MNNIIYRNYNSSLEKALMNYCYAKYNNKPCQVSGLNGVFVKIIDNNLFNYDYENYIILNNQYYNDFKNHKDKYLCYFTQEQKNFYEKNKKYDKATCLTTNYNKHQKQLFLKYYGIEYNNNIKKQLDKYYNNNVYTSQVDNKIKDLLKETTIDKGAGIFNVNLIRENFDKNTNRIKSNNPNYYEDGSIEYETR